MDKVSELLQEAKPLYFKRKKRNEIVKKSLLILTPVLFCSIAILPFITDNNSDSINYYTSSTSVVEQMGFPTDDYGLLKAD